MGDPGGEVVDFARGFLAATGDDDFELRAGVSVSPLLALATAVLPPVLEATLPDLE